ncbi:MAG: hypothetical protein ACXVP4_07355 [Bacteroidia bacterium]
MNALVKDDRCVVLVLSCDKYADVWKPFFAFFDKYWPDCPYPVYLGTNYKEFFHPLVTQVFSNKKSTWSEELDIILRQLPGKYVLIILEDYFIYEPVNNDEINRILNSMESMDAGYTMLGAFPKKYDELWPHSPLTLNPELGLIKKGSKYRVCLQTAIWNKDILLKLLNPLENPWQFEIEASKRSNQLPNPFLCVLANPSKRIVHGPITYYCTALSAGKWMRGAVNLCRKENISIDLSVRPVESIGEELRRKYYIALPITLRKFVDYILARLRKKL